MHHHRNPGTAAAPRRAGPPPAAGPVQGLGLVDAFRIDVAPAQLRWLAAEIDTVRYCLEDELAHHRKRHEQPPAVPDEQGRPNAREAGQELDRRAYQLQVLAMIRDQLPISSEAPGPAPPAPGTHRPRTPGTNSPVTRRPSRSSGPRRSWRSSSAAPLATLPTRSSRRCAARAWTSTQYTDSTDGWRGRELPRVSPAIADRLRAIAARAHAFTDTYLHVLA
jgi:hypothetical protein